MANNPFEASSGAVWIIYTYSHAPDGPYAHRCVSFDAAKAWYEAQMSKGSGFIFVAAAREM